MTTTEDEIPEALLRRFPELEAVGHALRQHRNSEPVTAVCTKCGQPLSVVEAEATGVLIVTCPTGDTTFRAKR